MEATLEPESKTRFSVPIARASSQLPIKTSLNTSQGLWFVGLWPPQAWPGARAKDTGNLTALLSGHLEWGSGEVLLPGQRDSGQDSPCSQS